MALTVQKIIEGPGKRWLNVAEAACLLSIHPVQLRKLISRGEVPGAKKIHGVGIRLDRVRLEGWLERLTSGKSR